VGKSAATFTGSTLSFTKRANNLAQKIIRPLYTEPMKKEDWQAVLIAAVNRHFSARPPIAKGVLLVEDASRPSDTAPVIHTLIHHLQRYLPQTEFSLVVAGGAHRGLESENARKVPSNFPGRISIHDCTKTFKVGEVDGIPLWLNREVVEAELRIAVGTVNLHPLAGFSGGAKILTPGVAGLPTIFGLHDLAPGKAGQLETAIRRFANHVLAEFPVEFAVQLLTNSSGAILRLFTGELDQAWRSAADSIRPWVNLPFPGSFPFCLAETTPFDQNLFGIFKALPTLLAVVRPAGTGYLFSTSRHGLGQHLWRLDPRIVVKEREGWEQKIGNRQIRIVTDARIPTADWEWVFPKQIRPISAGETIKTEESIQIACSPLITFAEGIDTTLDHFSSEKTRRNHF
jgi:hypothetical protein